jgi:hypothetical protein
MFVMVSYVMLDCVKPGLVRSRQSGLAGSYHVLSSCVLLGRAASR